MRCRGAITVYLTLVFLLVLSVVFTTVESARIQASRMLSETALDSSLESMMAGYHRQLFENYGVFFFDGALGGNRLETDRLTGKIRDDMDYVIHPSREIVVGKSDFYKMQMDDVAINSMVLATDDYGKVFREQAIESVRFDTGVEFVESMKENYDWAMDNWEKGKSFEEKEQETSNSLDLLEEEKAAVDEEKAEEAEEASKQTNPAQKVNSVRSLGILELMYDDTSKVSSKALELSMLPSHRELNHGSGLDEYNTGLDADIMFLGYILNRFDHATSEGEHTSEGLDYQLEYLLIGEESDVDNLKGVIHRLLLIREGANFAYLLTDAAKVSEAYAMAMLLVGYTCIPMLIEATKYALLLAWAYAESVLDVKVLLAGKKSALVKTAANWRCSLSNIGEIASMDIDRMEDKSGVTYEQYLDMLLLIANQDDITMRAIDLIECNVRNTTENPHFKMDHCVLSLEAKVNLHTDSVFLAMPVMSGYAGMKRKTMQIVRTYGYDIWQ